LKYYRYYAVALLIGLGWTLWRGSVSHSSGFSSAEGDNLVFAPKDDAGLARATKQARQTLPQFLAVLGSVDGLSDIGFKYGVKSSDPDVPTEFLWFDHVQYSGGKLEGQLANYPEWVDMSYGDPITVDAQKIEDWKYAQNGVMHGAYSIRVFRDRMTPQQRRKFDAELGARLD